MHISKQTKKTSEVIFNGEGEAFFFQATTERFSYSIHKFRGWDSEFTVEGGVIHAASCTTEGMNGLVFMLVGGISGVVFVFVEELTPVILLSIPCRFWYLLKLQLYIKLVKLHDFISHCLMRTS